MSSVPRRSGAPRRRPQSRGLVTREKLVSAARDLFAREGYDGASIGDVARSAGVGVGTVYHHFPDKRTLLLELLDRQIETAGAKLVDEDGGVLAHALQSHDFHETLVAGMLAVRSLRLAEPATSVIAMDLARRDPEIDRAVRAVEERFIGFVRGDIIGGLESGRIRPGVDVDPASRIVWRSFDSVLRLAVEVDDDEADRVFREFAEMIGRYLLGD